MSSSPETTAETTAAPAGGGLPATRRRPRLTAERLIRALLPLTALVVMFVYFSLSASAFLSSANLTFMSGEAAVLLLTSLGATLVILMGSVDLSVGSAALVTGAILAKILESTALSVPLVILLAIAVGIAIGLINGLVFAYGKVPSFITTLGTLSLFAGIGLTFMHGQSISFVHHNIQQLAIGQSISHVQNAALVAVAAFVVVWYITRRTRFGLYLYAIGGNETVVELAGIKVNRIKVMAMVVSGITAALGGMLMMAELSSAGPSLGSSTLLDSIAAIVIGGTALSGGVGGVERTLLGVLILTVLSNGLNQMNVESFTQTIIKGAVIIVAAIFTMSSQRGLRVK